MTWNAGDGFMDPRNVIEERHEARRRMYLLAQMYNVLSEKRTAFGDIPGASLWGAKQNRATVQAMAAEGLVTIHPWVGKRPALLTTLTPSGIEEGRAALATLYLTGEQDPNVSKRNFLPDWMQRATELDGLPGELP